MLFAPGDDMPFSPLTVRPTARLADSHRRIQISGTAYTG
jgi:hypothetical protein